ncbi:hypothetical protein Gotri_008376 [Gossypium trilobum]|uniref:Uncharacterized protein n=1 Tax=Gossypium trilobum TaxID=34281 RepID=A0A7J9EJY1_9ROSI|nr:hypothetical protein [Gossypium trilobum]
MCLYMHVGSSLIFKSKFLQVVEL